MADALRERLEALEVKLAYADDLLEELNLTVFRQQQQIELLQEQIRQLRQQLPADTGGAAVRSLRDELPPHY
ncbi:SlyX family protein [Comamonas humi]